MKVELSGHKFDFPRYCACCDAGAQTMLPVSASRTTGKRVKHTTSKAWDVPYCIACIEHVRAAKWATIGAISTFVCGVFLALTASANSPLPAEAIFWTGVGGSIAVYALLTARAKNMRHAQCSGVRIAVAYGGWHGTLHKFKIASPAYSLRFMTANQGKLVNVRPEVWQWLQANGVRTEATAAQSPRRYQS
jgi:hypothetical protein